ncbi:MAG TPA: MHYT domain-containing protein [Ramlibacter sp.]|jgi:NO-binding membrane sensor protein with MHYT domain|uniref:MHYT domain-containing protein n=1 Tax=Ramlibacter sp. TaxID=1917967 RepID=UPI002D430BC3|nr:MHYT domain-containing protein [Ramlibacter sp.]HZY18495.1 MHYT domain-containing protein [Ramlibacter sp.]
MNTPLTANHDLPFVVLSYVISAVGAFVALTAIAQMRSTAGRQARLLNLLAAAVSLGGIGIWAMHFIGMLSLRLGMGVSYSLPETLVSLLAAIAASGVALGWVSRKRSLVRLLGGGLMLGTAVLLMHYLGMYGMRFNGFFQWSAGLVGASVAIAYGAAIAGLWLAFSAPSLPLRTAASLVIGVAVCAMHYTGMAAAGFVCTSPNPAAFPTGTGLVTSMELPVLVTTLSLGMTVVIAIDQFFQRFGSKSQASLQRAHLARQAR